MTLTEGTDYELSYRNNTNPGTATVVVTGKGKYQGAVEKNFTIEAVDAVISGYEEVSVETAVNQAPPLPGRQTGKNRNFYSRRNSCSDKSTHYRKRNRKYRSIQR